MGAAAAARGLRGDSERLEFVGDAALDMMVTQHYYFAEGGEGREGRHHEGTITVLRSAVVNNTRLAAATLKLGLDGVLKMGGTYAVVSPSTPRWVRSLPRCSGLYPSSAADLVCAHRSNPSVTAPQAPDCVPLRSSLGL